MRLTLIAFGTRGDITPYVALGIRLRAEGHDVCLVSHPEFESAAERHGLAFRAVPGSFQDFIATHEGRRALGVPRSTPFGLAGLLRPFDPCAEEVYGESWQASEGTEGVIASAVATPVGSLIARGRGVPLARGQVIPSMRTGAMPHPVFPTWPLGPLYNRATYAAGDMFIRRTSGHIFGRWDREAERLREGHPVHPIKVTTLIAVSPRVIPRPDDWSRDVHVTGYWLPPRAGDAVIPEHLKSFVETGAPPICLGFGSMMDDNPEELRAIVLEALTRLDLRAVIVAGSGSALLGFGNHPNVCEVAFADYEWLFPRVRAVVHQGGAGTASYCLTAGVPQVIVRYCLDHNHWAWRMRELGVAPQSLVRHRLTAAALAGTIRRALEDQSYRRRAAALAPLIRAEDGAGTAVRIIQEHFLNR